MYQKHNTLATWNASIISFFKVPATEDVASRGNFIVIHLSFNPNFELRQHKPFFYFYFLFSKFFLNDDHNEAEN